ncbi:hypothetical protein Patl1_22766 [Pistacia atlantica]|uniref:Uncharacterized protein n=1 Tax=Pistacia atlantica TaxID=434234 RepID=A0ACC1A1D2_9ROSI|nr:hypothetical protein Patl1_22766 [Pistacia atlantica]
MPAVTWRYVDVTYTDVTILSAPEIEVIHSWSAPGSISTSLVYSFGQVDFDGFCLDSVGMTWKCLMNLSMQLFFGRLVVDRPYKEELLSKMESDGHKVVKDIIYGPGEKKYRFCKHMVKQRVTGLPDDLLKKAKQIILIQNPLDIMQSFGKFVRPSVKELGLTDLLAVWEAGPKPIDGFWAPWWYKSAHKSTGFKPPRKYPELLLSSFFIFSHFNYLFMSCWSKVYLFTIMLRRHVRKSSSLLKTPLPEPDFPVPANKKLLAWVGDEILPRDDAKVSVFDSIVQGMVCGRDSGVYNGKIFKLEEHLDWMFDSTKALAFNNVPTHEEIKEAIFKTLIRNGMFDNAHIRLTLTRGKKVTSGMGPGFNLYGCTLIVLPEWKPPVYDNTHGVTLVTATTRRNSPCNLDSKIHHNNLLNNILAKIEGNNANAADAIMLDKDGYVSETNATNIFMVKKGLVLTPHADYCLPGITRATVMDVVVEEKLVLEERRISLSEFHTADEYTLILIEVTYLGVTLIGKTARMDALQVWTTGTMGELSPVVKIDGRIVGDGKVGPVTQRLQNAFNCFQTIDRRVRSAYTILP